MTRARAAGVAMAGLALHAILWAGLAGALPGPVRLAAAFTVVILFPGCALVALGMVPPGGPWLAPGWAFGFGVAWSALLLLLSRAVGAPFLALLPWLGLLNALPWAVVAWRGRRPVAGGGAGLPPWVVAVVLLAVAFGIWHVARFGPVVGFSSDTPDHIGTLRRMLQSGDLFPADAFFRDAGRMGVDPRKGLWHGVVALIARLAGLDPLPAWLWLGALIVPFFVLNTAAIGFLCRPPAGAALAAWAFLLTYGASLSRAAVRHMVFSSRLGDHLAIATTVAVLADLRARSRATRVAALVLGFAAVAAHVFAAIEFAIAFTALGLGLLVRDRRPGPDLRRLLATSVLLAVACLPYLLYRAGQAYAPSNVIHTESQGLLFLTDSLRVVSIGQLWEWMGSAWVLVPLAWPWLWQRGRQNPTVLYLLTASLAVALIIFDPPLVAVLEPRLGYLLMRLIWLVPFSAIVAWLLPELFLVLREGGSRWRRFCAAATLVCAGWLLWTPVFDAILVTARPRLVTDPLSGEDPRRWQAEFDWMRRHLAPDCVVLSDPATSYMVPMMTGRYVATLVDQHSSPNDSLALARILDARDALDPYGTWDRTREVVRRHGVDVIVLNDRFAWPPQLDYWTPQHGWFVAARARLDAQPAAFPKIYARPDFVVYRVERTALDTLSTPARPRPFVRPWRPGAFPAPQAMGDRMPVLLRVGFARTVLAPGDSVVGVLEWRAPEPLPAGSYHVVVRFDRDLPGRFRPPDFLRKPVRKVMERLRHERYRLREDHLPVNGAYGVDRWAPDEVVQDSFVVSVPPDAAPGRYRVEVRMLRVPHFINLRLGDWFFDEDTFSGPRVGVIEIRRHGGRGSGPGRDPAGGADGA